MSAPNRRRIGVCSWSLRPTSPADLVEKLKACGVSAVQLALDPIRMKAWAEGETATRLKDAGIAIASGMMAMKGEDYSTLESIKWTGGVVPDEHWDENRGAAERNAQIAARLGIGLVTFHAGYIPEGKSPRRDVLLARWGVVADAFAARGVRTALETGQETAKSLLAALQDLDRPNVGVNFDPANMILYGKGDPIASLRMLMGRVFQVHIKDAVPSPVPGKWGTEVPGGTGAVDWGEFIRTLNEAKIDCDMMIEREGGDDRVGDIKRAREMIEAL